MNNGLRMRVWGKRAAARAPWVLAAAVLVLATAYAWVSEDAFITLRTVDHFVSGRGLVWNPGERVQAFTHPLWMFVLSACYALTREPLYTTIALSLVTTALVLWLLLRGFKGRPAALLLVLLALAASRSFIDWSTSGLENPLTHLLALSYCFVLYRGAVPNRGAALQDGSAPNHRAVLWRLGLLAALATLNRPDTALLFIPSLGYVLVQALRQSPRAKGKVVAQLAACALPVVVWEAFSLFYYGALVPNTALAKLNHGIARAELMQQGLKYLWRSTTYDPVQSGVIVCALVLLVFTRSARSRCLLAGVFGYVLYVVWVGGDFMAGRFLTTPLIISLVVLGQASFRFGQRLPRGVLCWGTALVLVVFGALAKHPTLSKALDIRATKSSKFVDGVADERRYYASRLSLFSAQGSSGPKFRWRTRGEKLNPKPKPGERWAVHVMGNIGVSGYYSRPGVTIVDPLALTDPLLARLPARYRPVWRMGHFGRALPAGYLKSVATGESHFKDKQLARLWRDIHLVTRGPLLAAGRLQAIFRLNSSASRELVDLDRYRYDGAPRWKWSSVSKSARVLSTPLTGVFIVMDKQPAARALSGSITAGKYRVLFRSQGRVVAERALQAKAEKGAKKDALVRVEITAPAALAFDELHILPTKNRGFQLKNWR